MTPAQHLPSPGRGPGRRSVLTALGAAGTGAALAACGGPGSGSGGATAAPDPGGDVSGTVNFYHWRSEDKAVLEELAAEFSAQHDGVTLEQTIDPSEQYQSTAAQKARDGEIGDVLTAFRGTQLDQFADLGIFTDMSDVPYLEDYQGDLIGPGQYEGTQLGLPYQLVFNMPLLNIDLAEKAGVSEVPGDWDAYLDLLDKLAGSGVTPIAWPGNDPASAFQIINSLVMNNGPDAEMFAKIESGQYRATDDWWITCLTQFQELSGYFQDNFSGSGIDGVLSLFTQEKAAILPTGSYQIGQVRSAGAEFALDLSPVMTNAAGEEPTYEGIFNSTFILGVNSQAKNPEGAAAWIEFLSDPVHAAAYGDGTTQHVTVKDVEYENPDLQALAPWQTRNTLLAPRFQFIDLDIRSAVENSLVAVATGTSPEQAAEEAQALVEEKL
ncbi:ABC transporter substrate-binding protein [Brachybacterium sacelli]|uniref:Raffinose/stachyose/melibiose transport system substrate-binding protein n=1 Tax=Brachybacterium sacelli TaxID=173364 RepID=A0ABS4X081_9MICO|nr:extracellular solute-binding protein [Brachybacterium sacelli]MBP2381781.1 raffinose/stachyose/melibiose transport system substrate-binding protein [Brachybacterium sacelli]